MDSDNLILTVPLAKLQVFRVDQRLSTLYNTSSLLYYWLIDFSKGGSSDEVITPAINELERAVIFVNSNFSKGSH